MAFDIIKAPKDLALKDKVSNLRYELKHRDSLCLIFCLSLSHLTV